MGFITEFLREFGLFIVYIIVAICGVLAGKALKDRKLARQAEAEAKEAEAALPAEIDASDSDGEEDAGSEENETASEETSSAQRTMQRTWLKRRSCNCGDTVSSWTKAETSRHWL